MKVLAPRQTTVDFRETAQFLLAGNLSVDGQLTTEEDVYIDCQFVGKITTTNHLELGPNCDVTGDLQARFLTIYGSYSGKALVDDEIDLYSSAHVKGELHSRIVEIARGALVWAKVIAKIK